MFQVCLLEANNLCFAGKRRVCKQSEDPSCTIGLCFCTVCIFFILYQLECFPLCVWSGWKDGNFAVSKSHMAESVTVFWIG